MQIYSSIVQRKLSQLAVLATSVVFVVACSNADDNSSDTTTETTEDGTFTFSDSCFDSTDQTVIMACLAENLLSTLSTDEVSSISYDLTQENATDHWSNLPLEGSVTRNGIPLEDMGTESKEAAEILIDAALSTQGQGTSDSLRLADQYLADNDNDRVYGQDKYAVAFLGSPSETDAWVLEFSGHHYTFFASYNGEPTSATPYFVAVEPVSFEVDGTTYTPMATHKEALVAMFEGLSATELTSAQLSEAYDDVLVGPQQDGDYPETSEGLLISSLTDDQKALVAAAIDVYAGDSNGTEQSANYTSAEQLDATYIAWASYSDLETQGSYARIDGPNVWIEFTVQAGVAFTDPHYHSIWRDKELDYGGSFDF